MLDSKKEKPTVIEFEHVTKQYPGVVANDDINLQIKKGEIFAIVGENGAGKSTLMNLLFGLNQPTLGKIYINGKKCSQKHTPQKAMQMGVGMVHQHFKLVPNFTVAQNVFLGNELKKSKIFYDSKKMFNETKELSKHFNMQLNPNDVVSKLSVGLQQRVEILKALRGGVEILVLDEPTAVLTPHETDELFSVISQMVSQKNMTVILITHKLNEVMQLSSRVAVMRKGKLLSILDTSKTNEKELASLMVGRDVIFDDLRQARQNSENVLCIKNLKVQDDRGLLAVKDVSVDVHKGEIVGICGVEGNGQTQLAEAIMGMRKQVDGEVLLKNINISKKSPLEIRQMGVSYIPEDRIQTGLSTQASIEENLVVGKHRLKEFRLFKFHYKKKNVRKYANNLTKQFDVRHSGVNSLVSSLSGGNMQKVIIAREFSFNTPVLIINQPTRGVDIGAIEFIHEKIIEKRNEDCAILLISADLDELFRLSDRLVTMFEGKITGRFKAGEIEKKDIGYYMTSAKHEVEAKI